jgi:hypothetical protein
MTKQRPPSFTSGPTRSASRSEAAADDGGGARKRQTLFLLLPHQAMGFARLYRIGIRFRLAVKFPHAVGVRLRVDNPSFRGVEQSPGRFMGSHGLTKCQREKTGVSSEGIRGDFENFLTCRQKRVAQDGTAESSSGSTPRQIPRQNGLRVKSRRPFLGMRPPHDLIRDRDRIHGSVVTRRLSANPNDCVEVRWGASDGSEEASTCKRHAPQAQRTKMSSEYRTWFHERYWPTNT